MKHARVFSLTLIFASTTLFAQSSLRNTAQAALARAERSSMGCPVDMQAQRQPGQGTAASVGSGGNGVAQSLHLIINNPRYAEVVGVRITVHGFNAKGHVSPAQIAAADSSEITKTLDLKLKISGKSQASADLALSGFTSIESIELDSVQYAGGSAWRSSAVHACHVIPDGLMLISQR